MKIKVGVIYGGETVEHEVSIISAVQAMNFMDEEKYEVVPIYIGKDRTWYTGKMLMEMDVYKDFDTLKRYAKKVVLTKKNNEFVLQSVNGLFRKDVDSIDIALLVAHGKGVEDGSLSGYLETIGIPYVGPSMLGASVGQDKVIMKQIMKDANIPVVDYTWFYDYEYLEDSKDILKSIKKLTYPVIVKPARLGSSVGITVVKREDKIEEAIEEAIKYDNKIIVEKIVSNLVEVDQAVLGNYEYTEVSATVEMLTKNDFLTYEDKYISSGKKGTNKLKTGNKVSSNEMIIPARITKDIEKQINDLSVKTFKALNLSGVARIDYLIDKKSKKVYVNEPNTIPGSLAFYMWKAIGKDYPTLLDELISLAIKDYKKMQNKTTSFETNILSTYNGGAKGMKGKMKI